MPVLVRNNEPGPTVLTVDKDNAFEWKGKGDPNGEDLQHLPDSVAENVNFMKAVNRGIFTIEEASEDTKALLEKQGSSFRERMEAQRQASAASLDQEANNDLVQVDCIGPSARGIGQCGAPAMVKDKKRDEKPPLCSAHEGLAHEFVVTDTDTLDDDGKTKKTWQRMTVGPREQAPK